MKPSVLSDIIKASLWGSPSPENIGFVSPEIYEEIRNHAIEALPCAILSGLSMSPELRKTWQMAVYRRITYNVNYRRRQKALPVTVPYVVLKGTSAAQYYPHPEYRTMGDIDIMTGRGYDEAACEMLIKDGFHEITGHVQQAWGRHRQFIKNGIAVEVHSQYAYQNDPVKAEYLDGLIRSNINPAHVLPDLVNGLTLIDHINHHMEEGLGLRQILDWMMFVYRCLPDKKWPEFQKLAAKTGHEKLAAAVTQMCVMYLGLPKRKWCAGADPRVCRELWEYVLMNGNFGVKQGDGSRVSAHFFSSTFKIKDSFQFLQERGLLTWAPARKYRILRPFAFIYQAGRYLKKGLFRKQAFSKIGAEQKKGARQNKLFEALGVTREEKGLVKYKQGKYTKK